MNQQLLNDISKYVEDHIGEFHAARIAKLQNMNLKEILKRKNPYQIKAMRAMSVCGFVEYLIDDAIRQINSDLFNDWMMDVVMTVLQTKGNNHCEAPHVITLSEFCSPEYWTKTLGDEKFFADTIEPAIESSFMEDDECYELKVRNINRFTKDFFDEYCDSDCAFDWDKLKTAMLWE